MTQMNTDFKKHPQIAQMNTDFKKHPQMAQSAQMRGSKLAQAFTAVSGRAHEPEIFAS